MHGKYKKHLCIGKGWARTSLRLVNKAFFLQKTIQSGYFSSQVELSLLVEFKSEKH